MPDKVMYRYQDRRRCSACNNIVERLVGSTEDGSDVNKPAYIPRDSMPWVNHADVVMRNASGTRKGMFGRGVGREEESEFVELVYFCPRCQTARPASMTYALTGNLPSWCYYDDGGRPGRAAITSSLASWAREACTDKAL